MSLRLKLTWGVLLGVIWLLGMPTAAEACATCFGASDSSMARGMNMGIVSLLGVIGFVLAGIASFFGYLAWRVGRNGRANPDDDSEALGWPESVQGSES